MLLSLLIALVCVRSGQIAYVRYL